MRGAIAALAAGIAGTLLLARPPREIPYRALAAELDETIGGERRSFPWHRGRIGYRAAGVGTPVLLVHGINATASGYEMRCNFGPLAEDHRVYLPDLLGFGLSERPALRYTADTYTDLLAEFLREVVGEPAHVIASSLSAAYAVAVAAAHPELVRSLVLICPTGIERLSGPPVVGQRVADWLLGLPVVGPKLFAALLSRPSIGYFLRGMTYHDEGRVTAQMIDLQHHLGQRPGGRWAPQAFVGGRLNRDIAQAFASLRQPVALVWGKQAGRATPLSDAPAFLERNPRAILKVFDEAELVPHDEQAEAFNTFVSQWIEEHNA